jgi:hypothetical protein
MIVTPVGHAPLDSIGERQPAVRAAHGTEAHDPLTCPLCARRGLAPRGEGEPPRGRPEHGESQGSDRLTHRPRLSPDGILWLPTLPPGQFVSTEEAGLTPEDRTRRLGPRRSRLEHAYAPESGAATGPSVARFLRGLVRADAPLPGARRDETGETHALARRAFDTRIAAYEPAPEPGRGRAYSATA